MDSTTFEPDTPPPESDDETLHEWFFGTPALDTEDNEVDRTEAYFLVRMIAEKYPGTVRKAACDGSRDHYRNAHPFNYSVGETRARGEVTQ